MQAIADKLEIIETLGRYALAVDFRELDNLRDVFTEDADIAYDLTAVGGAKVEVIGVAGVTAWLRQFLQGPPRPQRSLTNHVVDLNGDTAFAQSYLNTLGKFKTQWTRTPQGWRIAHFRMRAYAPA